MKNIVKKVIALTVVCSLGTMGMLCGCNGGGSEDVAIIDFGSLMPTANTTATVDNPEVIQVSKHIINKYMQEKGVTLEWATNYGRSASDNLEKTTSWYNQQVNTNNCPIIGYTSLNMFQDLDYYVTLDEYLEQPNPYVEAGQPGSVHWKDMFYDYVWEDQSIRNVKGEIVAIPILLSVGSQTAYYYNKNLVKEKDVPESWEEFVDLVDELKADGITNPFVPYTGYTKAGLYQWALEFNFTPNVMKYMQSTLDYDGDGTVTELEVLRGVLAGEFDPRQEGPAQAVYDELYNYYKNTLTPGWGSYDYTTNWTAGNVAMWNNGLWNIPMENSNTGRKFEYGIFTTPLVDSKTTKYAVDTEYYDSFDEVKNPVSVGLNIMKPAVEKNPDMLDVAVDILMYITAKNNNSAMASEKGGTMGAVKGTTYNTLVDNIGWKEQSFPKVSYSCKWPTGYTAERSGKINDEFEKWVDSSNPGKARNECFQTIYENQKAGALEFVRIFGIDTTGWTIV